MESIQLLGLLGQSAPAAADLHYPWYVAASYFAAAVLFILGLKRMSSPVTARSGIVWAGYGMVIATIATFLVPGLQNLGLMFGESQALQAASMVGRSAYIGTDIATLEGESGVQGSLTAPGPGPVTVEVRTPGGQLVRSFVVEARAGGAADFHWDGLNANGQPAANGEYRITAKQNATAAQVQVATRIDSVSYTSQGVVLNLVGVGPTTFDRITRIGQA